MRPSDETLPSRQLASPIGCAAGVAAGLSGGFATARRNTCAAVISFALAGEHPSV